MTTEAASPLIKRSMRVERRRTSVALEPQFWAELERIACLRRVSLPRLLAQIDKQRAPDASLASAARVFALLNAPAVQLVR